MNALRRTQDVRPRALEARVSNPDPNDLTVTIDEFDGHQLSRHAWPAVAWPVSPTATPARGDRCLVVTSEIGRVWIVAAEWTGAALEWTDLALRGWSAEDAGPRPGYARSPTGWVTFRGVIRRTDGTPGSGEQLLADPLPEPVRPASRRSFPALLGRTAAAPVHVGAGGQLVTGTVSAAAAEDAVVLLDGIGYWAED